jgi:dihydrofolate synthase / folylpolyglutamate synthase
LRSLADWLSYQQRTHPRAVDLSLERVSSVARRLGLLDHRGVLAIVGGTNGKGSTATTLAHLLQACGRRVGLFTSPHLVRYNERIQINGQLASDEQLIGAFERIESARADVTLTFFEYNALAALDIFRQSQIDVTVLEVGLGGRLDATNIVDADVAVLCSIGMDHSDWLGNTLEQIGAEKAGIFRAGQKVVLGSQDMPSTVWSAANELNCDVWTAQCEFDWQHRDDPATAGAWDFQSAQCELLNLPAPALAGEIQYRNACTALAALQRLNVPDSCDPARVSRGLRRVSLPGRFQIVPGDVEWILDVAHNEPAAAVLAAALAARLRTGRTLAIAGMLTDKDAAAIVKALDSTVDHWVLTGISDDARGLSSQQLLARLPPLRGKIELTDHVAQGCERARAWARPGDRIVVLGSFHVVGPALSWLGLY